jgi:hypothetical protein
MSPTTDVTTELHVSRPPHERYELSDSWFAEDGHVAFSDVHGVRVFAQQINEKRVLAAKPDQPTLKAGQLNAMALIGTILHYVAHLYIEQTDPRMMGRAYDRLSEELGTDALDAALRRHVEEFPPLAVYQKQTAASEYLTGETDGTPNRELVLEEILMLWLDNMNPAASPFTELFDDVALESQTSYLRVVHLLREFFASQPRFGPGGQNLIDLLRSTSGPIGQPCSAHSSTACSAGLTC